MLNIYGQNQDKPDLLREVFDKLEQNVIRNWILCGDWNLVLNQNLDTYNYLHHNNQITQTQRNFPGFDLVHPKQQDSITS